MRADNSQHLIAAARERAERTRTGALRALRRLDEAGVAVTFEAIAREAGVSRSWLYSQVDLRAEIEALRTRTRPSSPAPMTPQRQRASDTSLLRRLEAATARLRQIEEDNQQLREALAEALGTARAARVTGMTSHRDTPTRQGTKLTGPC